MAKVQSNSALRKLRGAVDGWVYRQMFGQTVVSPRPRKRGRIREGAERATNDRFRQAAQWASRATPEMIERYNERAARENKTRFSIRTRDYMVPPHIPAVYLGGYSGQPGEAIFVIARDDFEVKEVRVVISRPDASVIETGSAVRCGGDVFRYDTSCAIPAGTETTVEVTASDWPGNVARWRSPVPFRA